MRLFVSITVVLLTGLTFLSYVYLTQEFTMYSRFKVDGVERVMGEKYSYRVQLSTSRPREKLLVPLSSSYFLCDKWEWDCHSVNSGEDQDPSEQNLRIVLTSATELDLSEIKVLKFPIKRLTYFELFFNQTDESHR